MPRVGVVGHVEWVTFARVASLPKPGEIVHASEAWDEAGGGGAVAAVQLARLAGECLFLTALGDDDPARRSRARLEDLGVRVHAAAREVAQRRAFTHVDAAGERSITVLGERIVPAGAERLPWAELGACDAVYFTGGDVAALRAARAAGVLVATPRARETLRQAGVTLDALVLSGGDVHERVDPGEFEPAPRLVVRTAGARGGTWARADGTHGAWTAAPVPGPLADTYGAGDSFAAGLTFGLAVHRGDLRAAVALAARCGAACLTGAGPYAGQLTAAGLPAPER